MPRFSYSAYTSTGEHVEGQIDAASSLRAADLLHQKGLQAYRTVEVDAGRGSALLTAQKTLPLALSMQDFASFARQLATLLQAELPLDQCLNLVATQAGRSKTGQFAERLAGSVISGKSLSASIEMEAPNAPRFMAPLIRAGEARGSLRPCLVDLARILERQVELRNRVRGALAYPAILMVVALLTIALIIGVLVPSLMPLFRDTGATPPFALRVADDLTRFLRDQWPLALTGLAALAGSLMWLWRNKAVRERIDRVLAVVPGIGPLIARTNTAMIARTLGTLLRNGVPLVAALGLSATVTSSLRFQRALEAAMQAVKEGRKLGAAMQDTGVFPDVALRFVSIGEEASRLDELLLHLADVSDADNHRQIEGLLTLLTPLITMVLGVLIGGLILSVMQAVLSVNEIAL